MVANVISNALLSYTRQTDMFLDPLTVDLARKLNREFLQLQKEFQIIKKFTAVLMTAHFSLRVSE